MPAPKLTRDKWLSEPEFKRLAYAARTRPHHNATRDYALLMTAGLGGLRCCEVLGLRGRDCKGITQRPNPLLRVKSAKKRRKVYEEIALPRTAAEALRAWIVEGEIKADDRPFPIGDSRARKLFKHYLGLAGLPLVYSFHSLRHFRGVMLYDRTRDVQLVKEALRHERITNTERYVHAVDSIERQAEADIDIEE